MPMSWWTDLKRQVKFCEPFSEHTTLKVGGIADIWFEPHNLRSLKKVLTSCRKKGIPFLVIGNGSNLLVKDSGVRAVVIHLNSPYFKRISLNNSGLTVGCAVSLKKMVNVTLGKGLGGCEFLAGIPGTIGGALITNAGVRDLFCRNERRYCSIAKKRRQCSIGSIVEEVEVIDREGKLRIIKRKDIRFGYRHSSLEEFIILKAKIKLERKGKGEMKSAIDRFMKYKITSQELVKPSAGSIFKNPPGASAGKLIESCGLKGFRIGDAQVSAKHANFIINIDKAQSRDILALIKLVQDRVRARYDIKLKLEIRIVGE